MVAHRIWIQIYHMGFAITLLLVSKLDFEQNLEEEDLWVHLYAIWCSLHKNCNHTNKVHFSRFACMLHEQQPPYETKGVNTSLPKTMKLKHIRIRSWRFKENLIPTNTYCKLVTTLTSKFLSLKKLQQASSISIKIITF